ncbi:hypothetical protein [Bartonella sp. HY406]|uniref:hypothetical protein n=1 Tax=Bartonella sp. HY406 TaxID=2979331 RepID=UPI0021C7B40B|nr:hypothetical protein [Bartonella sp. HY406]UXN04230.1 hypothetical protein N6B01_04150 [Bartonella sp. HY406]
MALIYDVPVKNASVNISYACFLGEKLANLMAFPAKIDSSFAFGQCAKILRWENAPK